MTNFTDAHIMDNVYTECIHLCKRIYVPHRKCQISQKLGIYLHWQFILTSLCYLKNKYYNSFCNFYNKNKEEHEKQVRWKIILLTLYYDIE